MTFAVYVVNTSVRLVLSNSVACSAFQWLKRVDSEQMNGTILFDGERYMVLAGRQNGIVIPRGDEVYLSRLTLVNVTEEHAGLYICSATNTHGYSYRGAYLTVLPANSKSRALAHA